MGAGGSRELGFTAQFWVATARLTAAPLPPGSVFQLTHDVYKPFIFAADTLEDLSM